MSDPYRIELTGELTIQTAADRRTALGAALEAAEQAGAGSVEVDLQAVTELDTAGLQVLLVAQREAAQSGRVLSLTGTSQAVADVLGIAHLDIRLDPRLVVRRDSGRHLHPGSRPDAHPQESTQ